MHRDPFMMTECRTTDRPSGNVLDASQRWGGMFTSGTSAGGILRQMAEQWRGAGSLFPAVREGVAELGPVFIAVRDPRKYLALVDGRRLNPWTSLCEFPWMMAGRADVKWLAPYMPRAGDFSDDGLTWRGAYGPRLGGELDQLAGVLEVLKADPLSRRAVMTLWDPEEDLARDSKDIPCTNWLHLQREGEEAGRLSLSVTVRSNDLIWGFSAVNARKTHCPQGHPLSGVNLLLERNGKSGTARRCRSCRTQQKAKQ